MSANYFRRAEDIGVRRVGAEIFILAPAGDLIVLGNETAVFLWDAVEAGASSAAALAAQLEQEYEVTPDQAVLDVEDFVGRLIERNVFTISEVPR